MKAFGKGPPGASRQVMRIVNREIDPETDADHAIQWMSLFRHMPRGAQEKAVSRLMRNPRAKEIIRRIGRRH